VQTADIAEHVVGLLAGAEVDLLERVAGVDEAPERGQLGVGMLAGPDVVQRRQRPDAQRPLAVEQPDKMLLVHVAEH